MDICFNILSCRESGRILFCQIMRGKIVKIGDSGKDKGLKKPYRKPTVDSRGLKLGVYGDYGRDDNNHSDGNDGHGGRGGHHGRGGHRGGHGL